MYVCMYVWMDGWMDGWVLSHPGKGGKGGWERERNPGIGGGAGASPCAVCLWGGGMGEMGEMGNRLRGVRPFRSVRSQLRSVPFVFVFSLPPRPPPPWRNIAIAIRGRLE